MNEQELDLINKETKKDRIIIIIKKNKKKIFFFVFLIIFLVISFFSYQIYLSNTKLKIANKYNDAIINYDQNNKQIIVSEMKEIINKKDKTYSPLALYFLLDNNLLSSNEEIENYFDILINETGLNKNIQNLLIYKKVLFISDYENEEIILKTIDPILKEKNIWTSHALYLLGVYYYENNKKDLSKKYFNKIISLEISNNDLKKEAKKRLQRDFSD